MVAISRILNQPAAESARTAAPPSDRYQKDAPLCHTPQTVAHKPRQNTSGRGASDEGGGGGVGPSLRSPMLRSVWEAKWRPIPTLLRSATLP